MKLTGRQKYLIERVVNVFETGTVRGDYGALSIYRDGPHGIRQITYGRAQTTEYGKLRLLVQRYASSRGLHSRALGVYAPDIGSRPLTDDQRFRALLREAGRHDAIMGDLQDAFFDEEFFAPAMEWADENGFTLPLSALVIYDSFIHSGSILWIIRSAFPESPPAEGGDERTWLRAYVAARHRFLAHHARPAVRKTVYRTRCLTAEIARGNWQLEMGTIRANGVGVG